MWADHARNIGPRGNRIVEGGVHGLGALYRETSPDAENVNIVFPEDVRDSIGEPR